MYAHGSTLGVQNAQPIPKLALTCNSMPNLHYETSAQPTTLDGATLMNVRDIITTEREGLPAVTNLAGGATGMSERDCGVLLSRPPMEPIVEICIALATRGQTGIESRVWARHRRKRVYVSA
jgi:hypothetical protein